MTIRTDITLGLPDHQPARRRSLARDGTEWECWMTQGLAAVSDEDWTELAKDSGLTGHDFKNRMYQRFGADDLRPVDLLPPATGALVTDGLCQITPFSTTLCQDIGCNGQITLCGPPFQWSADITLTFTLAGLPIATAVHRFNHFAPMASGVLSRPILRVNYTVGVKRDRWCFVINGDLAHLTPSEWAACQINRTVFCFGDIKR